jgi:acyl-CoA synthetase (AMP-forming)/AMP-acid ligase II
MFHTNCSAARVVRAIVTSRRTPYASRFSSKNVRMASSLPNLPIFQAIARHDPDSTAVIHSGSSRRFTYGELLHDVAKAKHMLHSAAGKDTIDGERIAFIIENSYDYVGALEMALQLKLFGR